MNIQIQEAIANAMIDAEIESYRDIIHIPVRYETIKRAINYYNLIQNYMGKESNSFLSVEPDIDITPSGSICYSWDWNDPSHQLCIIIPQKPEQISYAYYNKGIKEINKMYNDNDMRDEVLCILLDKQPKEDF